MSAEIQKFQAILTRLLAGSQKFTDEEFAPNSTVSIGGPYSKYPFRRASEILDHVAIFPQEITPTDIRQGLLSDSYLLSAIAALAEEPALIERLFLTEESNKAGLYAIWLCDNGVWRPILLDDHFPCKQYSGAYFPAFAQCHTGEIWIPLLEKAYAKINGAYFNIEAGFPHHVLRDLTGAPTEELYDESDIERIWDVLSRGMDHEYFLMCTTELLEDEKESEGLPKGHAYTVLDTREVQTEHGSERLILVRNPWSTFEWKGAWSKTSNLWTPELRNELNYPEDEEDSLFWMSLEDYQKYFPITWVCKYKKDNNYYSVSFDHRNNNNNVLRIKVRERQEVTISLNQRDRRFFKNTPHPDYFYSYSRILLAKCGKNGLEYVTGNASGFERNLQATHVLEPGTYLLTIEVNWNQKHWNEFNVSFYSEGRLDIESLAQVDLLAIQKNIIKSAIGKVETNKTVTNYGKYGDGQLTKTVDSLHGIFYFHYENRSRKKSKLCETIKFSQVNNLKICSPFTNDNQFEVTVLPGNDLLVLYKAVLDDYSWGYSASFFIQTANPQEEKAPANVYTYIDNPNNRVKVEVNENYNTHIKEESEHGEGEDPRRTGPSQRGTEEIKRSRPRGEDEYEEEKGHYDEEDYEDDRSYNRGSRKPGGKGVKPKEFPVTVMQLGQTNSKKVKYTNYDDIDKNLVITSTRPDVIQVKEPKLFVRAGESADLRLRFYAPREIGYSEVKLEIRLGKNPKVEEVLVFPIENRQDY